MPGIVGVISDIDHARRIVSIGAIQFPVCEELPLESARKGMRVTLFYERRDDRLVAVAIKPAPDNPPSGVAR